MKKAVYAAVFTPAGEGGYLVSIPDLPINTQGETIAEAIDMARDAICIWGISEQDMGRKIPQPTSLSPEHGPEEIVALIDVDFDAYRRALEIRSVRRNVTLPSWLNELGEKAGVNFSQVLQDGLKEKLHITDR